MYKTEKPKDNIDYSKIYSPTKLSLFKQCPKQYHFNYISEVHSKMKSGLKKMPKNIFSFYTVGKAVHNAITLFYHQSKGERSVSRLKDLLNKAWISEVMWNKKPPLGEWGGFESLEEEREAYRDSLEMLNNFYEMAIGDSDAWYLPTDDLKHSIEDYKSLITPLYDDICISGKFDLVTTDGEGSLNVIDFKTSKKDEADEAQLRFYKLLAEMKFNKPVSKASLIFLRSKVRKDIDLREVSLGSLKESFTQEIKNIINAENFETRPGKLCRYCLFKTYCPERQKVEEILKSAQKDDYPDDLPF